MTSNGLQTKPAMAILNLETLAAKTNCEGPKPKRKDNAGLLLLLRLATTRAESTLLIIGRCISNIRNKALSPKPPPPAPHMKKSRLIAITGGDISITRQESQQQYILEETTRQTNRPRNPAPQASQKMFMKPEYNPHCSKTQQQLRSCWRVLSRPEPGTASPGSVFRPCSSARQTV